MGYHSPMMSSAEYCKDVNFSRNVVVHRGIHTERHLHTCFSLYTYTYNIPCGFLISADIFSEFHVCGLELLGTFNILSEPFWYGFGSLVTLQMKGECLPCGVGFI